MIRIYIYSFTPHHRLHLHFSPYTYSLSSLLPHIFTFTLSLVLFVYGVLVDECPLDSFRPSSLPLFYSCPSPNPHTCKHSSYTLTQCLAGVCYSTTVHSDFDIPLTPFLAPTPHTHLSPSTLTLTPHPHPHSVLGWCMLQGHLQTPHCHLSIIRHSPVHVS